MSRLATIMLCLALLFKAAVPLGFMPDMEALARGSIRIMICSAYGTMPMVMDAGDHQAMQMHHGMKHSDKSHHTMPQQHDDHFCAFSSIAPLIFALVFFLLAGGVTHRPAVFIFRPVQFRKTSLNRAARSRAPPLLLTA